MIPEQRKNLARLLAPRHLAVIGGRDAEHVIRENRRIGFAGKIFAVNPKRAALGGIDCVPRVQDLPEAPDAVFVAVPKDAVLEVVESLRVLGAGGVVCYTAGFGELGGEGKALEHELVGVAGDMALIGPNCYGMINYLHKSALWPFEHRGDCLGAGVAIVTQSGMMSSDITMSQRHLPLTHMISAGNQASLQLEDFVDMLCETPEVRALGLHIEGVRDIAAFEKAARKALEYNTPVVAFKTGTSKIGAALTISHTGSLSGEDDLYQALFDRLGIIRVDNLVQMLETLKFISIAGIPRGGKLIGFTCSGGGATMIADEGEKIGITLPPIPECTRDKLTPLLPEIATISNPLDYTTPIWGMQEKTEPVFRTCLGSDYDAAMLIQDFPHPDFPEIRLAYLNDSKAFVAATRDAGIAAMVCSTLPENMDSHTREFLAQSGVAPMQGLPEAMQAFKSANRYRLRRQQILASPPDSLHAPSGKTEKYAIDEWRAKQILRDADVPVAKGEKVTQEDVIAKADALGFPLALKINSASIAHKTEIGAVVLNLQSSAAAFAALQKIDDNVTKHTPDAVRDGFLLEHMAQPPLAELLVSIRQDAQFGMALTLASGGIFVELLQDAVTLLLPTVADEIGRALEALRIAPLFSGFRGQPKADKAVLITRLLTLADFACDMREQIAEIEINPLFIGQEDVCAVDVLMQFYQLQAGHETFCPS